MFFDQSHPNAQKIHTWKPKAHSNKTIFFKEIKKNTHPLRQLLPTTVNTFSDFISNNLIISESYYQMILQHTFSEFISNNTHITDTFRYLLPINTAHFFRVYIKQYWYKQFSDSSFQTIVKTFFRVYITQHWHFQTVTNKQYWLIQSSYKTVFTLS